MTCDTYMYSRLERLPMEAGRLPEMLQLVRPLQG